MLGYKTSLNNFKKIEIISSTFSNHNIMRLEISYKKKTAKNTNIWRVNNMLLNNQWLTKEIKENFKNTWRDFPGGAVIKNPPANAGDMGSSPGLGRSHMPQSN